MIFGSTRFDASPTRRPAAVAGLFYPGRAVDLARTIDDALAQWTPDDARVPKALIVPHAGYVYSGPIAAAAYASLARAKGRITRAVILGPCHRVPVRGLALPGAEAFGTPLGDLRVDADAVAAIRDLPGVTVAPAAHAQEHALEVQLPFLQRVLGDVAIVPLVVGTATADEIAAVLDRLWGGPETVILISSDLSHYHRYDDARTIDVDTVARILALDGDVDHDQACGATPIRGLLAVARRRGLAPRLLDLRNSGDTAGDRQHVVGYASIAFDEPRASAASDDEGETLIAIARGAIGEALGRGARQSHAQPWLAVPGASFVTLRQRGALRGCIGSLTARRALGEDVAANAVGAAFSDPRFQPLAAHELDITAVEVSVLSPPSTIAFSSVDELFARVRPGEDGIVLSARGRRATFLPQVWDDLPEPADFFAQLKRKAGLPDDHPLDRCTVERYAVRKFVERTDEA